MTQDTKDYDVLQFNDVPQEIVQAAIKVTNWCDNNGIKKWKINGCASRDWLEELQQPVGVEPVGYVDDDFGYNASGFFSNQDELVARGKLEPLYSAETVARLQAERDELVKVLHANKDLSDPECPLSAALAKIK